jgi:hypothetical protein
LGIKVPGREPWQKNLSTEETLNGNQEESRQEKETLSERMLVQKFPEGLSREAPLERLFRFGLVGSGLQLMAGCDEFQTSRHGMAESLAHGGGCTKSSCPTEANRARNAVEL